MAHHLSTPQNCDVTTIDGFLATCRRLLLYTSNILLKEFIQDAAKVPQLRREARSALCSRNDKRNQTREFVSLMDWATEEDNEERGLGFSDAAMDFHEHADVFQCGTLVEREWGELQLETEMGDYHYRRFLDAVAPRHLVYVGDRLRGPLLYLEPLSWAARHWACAGQPAIDPDHLIDSMSRAFLLRKEDANNHTEAARRLGYSKEAGILFKTFSLKEASALKGQHITQFWTFGRRPEKLYSDTIAARCQKNTKRNTMTGNHQNKSKHKGITRGPFFDFEGIPTEIFLCFVEFMTLKSLIVCRSVCKEWRHLIPIANIPPFRRKLLGFYDSVLCSQYFRAFPDKPRRSKRHHSRIEAVSLRTYFQATPEILKLWKLEWPGHTEVSFQGPSWRYPNGNGKFYLHLFLGKVFVGSTQAKSEFQECPLSLIDLEQSPEMNQHHNK